MRIKIDCIFTRNLIITCQLVYDFLFEFFKKFSEVCFSSIVLINHVFKCYFTHFALAIHIPPESFKSYCVAVYTLGLHKLCPRFKNFFKMAPHTGSATPEQIDTLLNFLDEHKDLARGRLRDAEGNLQAKRLWEDLCNILNSMGGCIKTVKQWQKVWFDRKHLAKKAAADSRRLASSTGGGPSRAPPLSHWQLKILSIMGERFGERQTQSLVPAFSETIQPIPSTSQSHEEVEYFEPSQEDQQLSEPASQPTVLQESLTTTLSSQPTRPRRRHSAAGSDVRSRLYFYEDGRAERETVRNTTLANINTELAGIKAVLSQLCDLIKQFIE